MFSIGYKFAQIAEWAYKLDNYSKHGQARRLRAIARRRKSKA